jgi:hypothetical protein
MFYQKSFESNSIQQGAGPQIPAKTSRKGGERGTFQSLFVSLRLNASLYHNTPKSKVVELFKGYRSV